MKTSSILLGAILVPSIIFFACSPNDEAKKTNRFTPSYDENSPQKVLMDSTSSAVSNNVADGSDNSVTDNKNESGAAFRGNVFKTQTFLQDQTEINPAYNDFLRIISSTAARPTRLDSTHKFVRTADLKFRAKNVANATYRIEDITARWNGYVANTQLSSEMQSQTETPVSKDSSLETMTYVVTNSITLRIPAENLDTALKSMVPLIDYLDYRNISMKDITLDLLSNKLAQQRIFNYNTRLGKDIDTKGKKLDDVQTAEQSILNAQENSDNVMIENLRQDDQVKYSTITIYLYQRETIRQELILRAKDVDAYEPGLGSKLSDSLRSGWHGLENLISIFVLLWPLWLIGIVIFYFVKWLVKMNKKVVK